MNIHDVQDVQVSEGEDMLVSIFAKQRELMRKYEEIEQKNGLLTTSDVPVNLHDRFGQQRLKDFAWRVTEEIGEAMNCLKNKPWKQTHMQTDEAHYKEELIDALHFFVELLILSGFTPHDVYNFYFKKNEVNKFRQESKY